MNRACNAVLQELKQSPHTSDELTVKTKLSEIPARICDLRELGYEINSTIISDTSRGFTRRIARYALIHSPMDGGEK